MFAFSWLCIYSVVGNCKSIDMVGHIHIMHVIETVVIPWNKIIIVLCVGWSTI